MALPPTDVAELITELIDIGTVAGIDHGDDTEPHWTALRLARHIQCDVEEALSYCPADSTAAEDKAVAS